MKIFTELEEILSGKEPMKNFLNNDIFMQSFIISKAFGSLSMEATHFLLAILKIEPNSLAVRYLETIQSKETWKKQWHNKLREKNLQNTNATLAKTYFDFFIKVVKTAPKERELLQCEHIDENCILLALLRYQDFDGLTYKDAIQFMKKHRENK